MAIKISTKGLGAASLDELARVFTTDRGKKSWHQEGGKALQSYLKVYHRKYGKSKKWENPSLPTHGRGRKKTRFATDIAKKWEQPVATTNSVTVSNSDTRLPLKVFGGTIRPRGNYALTIPMQPDAHGKDVKTYKQQYPKRRLVRPRGKHYLAWVQKTKVVVVYLLRHQMVYKPWVDALPSDQRMLNAFWYDGVAPHLDRTIARRAAKKAPTDV
jgi:hypothetical protein